MLLLFKAFAVCCPLLPSVTKDSGRQTSKKKKHKKARVKVHSLDSTTAFKESRISLIFQIFPSEELLEMPLNPSPVFIDA